MIRDLELDLDLRRHDVPVKVTLIALLLVFQTVIYRNLLLGLNS